MEEGRSRVARTTRYPARPWPATRTFYGIADWTMLYYTAESAEKSNPFSSFLRVLCGLGGSKKTHSMCGRVYLNRIQVIRADPHCKRFKFAHGAKICRPPPSRVLTRRALVAVEAMIGHYPACKVENHSLHRDELGGGGERRVCWV